MKRTSLPAPAARRGSPLPAVLKPGSSKKVPPRGVPRLADGGPFSDQRNFYNGVDLTGMTPEAMSKAKIAADTSALGTLKETAALRNGASVPAVPTAPAPQPVPAPAPAVTVLNQKPGDMGAMGFANDGASTPLMRAQSAAESAAHDVAWSKGARLSGMQQQRLAEQTADAKAQLAAAGAAPVETQSRAAPVAVPPAPAPEMPGLSDYMQRRAKTATLPSLDQEAGGAYADGGPVSGWTAGKNRGRQIDEAIDQAVGGQTAAVSAPAAPAVADDGVPSSADMMRDFMRDVRSRQYGQGGPVVPAPVRPGVWDGTRGGPVPVGPKGVDTVPAMLGGGPVMLDSQPGRREYVATPEMVDALGGERKLEALRARVHDFGAVERRKARDGAGGAGLANGGVSYGDWAPVQGPIDDLVQERRQRAVYGQTGAGVPQVSDAQMAARPAPNTRMAAAQAGDTSNLPAPVPTPARGETAALMPFQGDNLPARYQAATDTGMRVDPRGRPLNPPKTVPGMYDGQPAGSPVTAGEQARRARIEAAVPEVREAVARQLRNDPPPGMAADGAQAAPRQSMWPNGVGFDPKAPMPDDFYSTGPTPAQRFVEALRDGWGNLKPVQARRQLEEAIAKQQMDVPDNPFARSADGSMVGKRREPGTVASVPADPRTAETKPVPAPGVVPGALPARADGAAGGKTEAVERAVSAQDLGAQIPDAVSAYAQRVGPGMQISGPNGEGTAIWVPKDSKDIAEFGHAVLADNPAAASPGGFRALAADNRPQGTVGARAPDTRTMYGGVDLSNATQAERQAVIESQGRDAAALRAATAYMQLPEGQRARVVPPPAVAAVLSGAPSEGAQVAQAVEGRQRQLQAAALAPQAEIRKAQIEAAGKIGAEQAKAAVRSPADEMKSLDEYDNQLIQLGKGVQSSGDIAAGISQEQIDRGIQAARYLRELRRQSGGPVGRPLDDWPTALKFIHGVKSTEEYKKQAKALGVPDEKLDEKVGELRDRDLGAVLKSVGLAG